MPVAAPPTAESPRPFRIDSDVADPLRRTFIRAAMPAVEAVLRFDELNRIYRDIQRRGGDHHFADKVLEALGVGVRVDDAQLARIPDRGPLVVVANHPFGGIEGVILASILMRVRDDVKLLANRMLSVIPDLRDLFFFVDAFGTKQATRDNLASMRSAVRWIRDGGVLGVFPAGEVSHLHVRRRAVVDPAWNTTVARIVQRSGAAVVPVHFEGRNSNLFQLAGMIHPRLRTVMLPREMLRMRRGLVAARIGTPIGPRRLERFDCHRELTDYLRVRTYILKQRDTTTRPRPTPPGHAPIIEARPREPMLDEIAALPAGQRLTGHRDLDVYIARAPQIPTVLAEIGRLREIAFRRVGEGTGEAVDLDRFDRDYLHLFIWDRAAAGVVGAYRIGQTDRLLGPRGAEGLYTSTLFRYDRRLLERISPALELGRSFVNEKHQKSFAPLMLLWKGIGHYLVRHPRYRYLLGPVSISAEYSSMSKLLLLKFLRLHRNAPDLSRLLRPRNPPHLSGPRDWDAAAFSTVVRDPGEVDDLIADLEADDKPMPVLLRHYLTMGSKLLGFNVDPRFGDVLDGLVLCDVTHIAPTILRRYMGPEGLASYMAFHRAAADH